MSTRPISDTEVFDERLRRWRRLDERPEESGLSQAIGPAVQAGSNDAVTELAAHTNGATTKAPLVQFFEQWHEGVCEFATVTTAGSPEEFLREAGHALHSALHANVATGPDAALSALLPQICELWAKLKGYKSDQVYEERRLIVGRPHPEFGGVRLN